MTEPQPPARPIKERRSLRRRLGRSFVVALVLFVLLFATILTATLAFKSKGDEVIYRWSPAYNLSQDVFADLVNQETGLRGFALGRREEFLAPYVVYRKLETSQEERLREQLAGHDDLLARLDTFEQAAKQWRSAVAAPLIERVRHGDRVEVENAAAKGAFDAVRRAGGELSEAVRSQRDQARSDRLAAAAFALSALGGAALLVLVSGAVVWFGLRRAVLAPVEALARQTRDIAGGDTGQHIVATGPREIEGLGNDVDQMRARIVDELARVEAARQDLVTRTEDLARSNADLEQFAYVASHDLSEPLRKVANFCQLLERQYGDQLDDKARQYIAFAVDGAKRMQALIADLLEFSRVGRTADEFVDVDAGTLVFRGMANLDQRIVESGAEIVRGVLPTVHGDTALLIALFQNLIGNAVKYRSTERPRVEIEAAREDGQWRFTVTDNGIGIDRKYADRIFAIFQRLHLRDQYGGTGIGLALCRKIVEFHGGRIWLGEHDGRGARFHFTLPEAAGVAATKAAGQESA